MLKEIHHRVKNNLQIITSLLHSQGVYLKDKEALSAIRESQNRVHAMALIHQKLYQTDRLASGPIAEYTEEIIDYLINFFDREETVEKRKQNDNPFRIWIEVIDCYRSTPICPVPVDELTPEYEIMI